MNQIHQILLHTESTKQAYSNSNINSVIQQLSVYFSFICSVFEFSSSNVALTFTLLFLHSFVMVRLLPWQFSLTVCFQHKHFLANFSEVDIVLPFHNDRFGGRVLGQKLNLFRALSAGYELPTTRIPGVLAKIIYSMYMYNIKNI